MTNSTIPVDYLIDDPDYQQELLQLENIILNDLASDEDNYEGDI